MTTESELEEIRARHWRVGGRGTVYPEQCVCGLAWPCDAAFLLAEVERLRRMVKGGEDLQAAVRGCKRALIRGKVEGRHAVCVLEEDWLNVETALAALEAGDGGAGG